MKKVIVSLLLSLVLASSVVLTACENDDKKADVTSNSNVTSSEGTSAGSQEQTGTASAEQSADDSAEQGGEIDVYTVTAEQYEAALNMNALENVTIVLDMGVMSNMTFKVDKTNERIALDTTMFGASMQTIIAKIDDQYVAFVKYDASDFNPEDIFGIEEGENADDSTDDIIDDSTDDSTIDTTDDSTDDIIDDSTDDSTIDTTDDSTDDSIDDSTEDPEVNPIPEGKWGRMIATEEQMAQVNIDDMMKSTFGVLYDLYDNLTYDKENHVYVATNVEYVSGEGEDAMTLTFASISVKFEDGKLVSAVVNNGMMEATLTVSDYGTTVIELPAEEDCVDVEIPEDPEDPTDPENTDSSENTDNSENNDGSANDQE